MILDELILFLNKNLDKKKPVLLGYSGGVDSHALFHLLIECKKKINFELHVAHIDHSWRDESEEEAVFLKKIVEEKGFIFHLKKLKKLINNSNLEAVYRKKRIIFFKELFEKYDCQSLILAHHMQDEAETVLKRFLEGASFNNLRGMQKISFFDGMKVWRPLLDVKKKDLIDFLKQNRLKALDDTTNYDTKYLRAKMRQDILPFLATSFGKGILNNLTIASKRALELENYLDKKTKKYFQKRTKGEYGVFLDFSLFDDLEDLEIKYIIKKISKEVSFDISRDALFRVLESIKTPKKPFSIKLKKGTIISDKKRVFFQQKDIFFDFEKVLVKEGKTKIGNLEIVLEKIDKRKSHSSWKDVFSGKIVGYLPKGRYFLKMPEKGEYFFKKRLSKWFYDNKVPSFLRFSFPVISKEDNIEYEFLSGKGGGKDFYYELKININN